MSFIAPSLLITKGVDRIMNTKAQMMAKILGKIIRKASQFLVINAMIANTYFS